MELITVSVVKESDRYISIERNLSGDIENINYWQGVTDNGLSEFDIHKEDKELTDFVLSKTKSLIILSIDKIDSLIWQYIQTQEIEEEKRKVFESICQTVKDGSLNDKEVDTHDMLTSIKEMCEDLIKSDF